MRIGLSLLLVAPCVSTTGCGQWIPDGAKSTIAANAQCPEDQMDFHRDGPIVTGRGCGRLEQAVHMCRASDDSQCTWRSVTELKEAKLRRRAAADFQCDGGQLTVTQIDQRSWNAAGCNQSGTYLWSCPTEATAKREYGGNVSVSSHSLAFADDCTWIMNSVRN